MDKGLKIGTARIEALHKWTFWPKKKQPPAIEPILCNNLYSAAKFLAGSHHAEPDNVPAFMS